MEVDATSDTKTEEPKAEPEPVPPVADVQPTATVQTPADTQSVVIKSSSNVQPTIVIEPSDKKQPSVVIEPSSPASQQAVDNVDSNTNDSGAMVIDDAPAEPAPAPTAADVKPSEAEKSVTEPVKIPVQPQLLGLPILKPIVPSSTEVKKDLPNVQVNNPASLNNVQPEKAVVNAVKPSESVPKVEENVQKIQKPIIPPQSSAPVSEAEPLFGHNTVVQVTAPVENQTVPDDLTTTASNGGDVCNNVPPLNNEETLKKCK